MANGTMRGEDTSCKKNAQYCLDVVTFWNGGDAHKLRMSQGIAPKYGEYVNFTGTFNFNDDEVSPSNAYFLISLYNIGKLFCSLFALI